MVGSLFLEIVELRTWLVKIGFPLFSIKSASARLALGFLHLNRSDEIFCSKYPGFMRRLFMKNVLSNFYMGI